METTPHPDLTDTTPVVLGAILANATGWTDAAPTADSLERPTEAAIPPGLLFLETLVERLEARGLTRDAILGGIMTIAYRGALTWSGEVGQDRVYDVIAADDTTP
jgi:hypothetical protein